MKYAEATRLARQGATIHRAGKIVRLLSKEEAEPIFLERNPHSRFAYHPQDHKDEALRGKLVVGNDGNLVVEQHGGALTDDQHPRMLGLFDVGAEAPIDFRPSEEDISGEWKSDAELKAEAAAAERLEAERIEAEQIAAQIVADLDDAG